MSFKLTKTEIKEKAEITLELQEKFSVLEMAKNEYEETVERATEFASVIANRLSEAMEEKSDRWKESDKGQAAERFYDAWSEFTPDDYELPDSADGTFEDLPDEMED